MNLNRPKTLLVAVIITVSALILLVFNIYAHIKLYELTKLRAHRAAVADVENFIYQQYPTIDAATRRGHAEILIEATTGKCAEITENAFACPGYGITKVAPAVRQYAAETHGLKP